MDRILVSVDCMTFNHEKFIRKAIESFLMQKTNFPFEVLVHDDASADGTAAIIREYEEKFPDIVKPIYQKENQYSQGVMVEKFNLERAQGKYIAICEGDDYWTDPYKLQKQVDYMESHPGCVMTIHAAAQMAEGRNQKLPAMRPAVKNKLFSIEEIIKKGGGFFATNSVMHRRKELEDYPEFYLNANVGDYPLIIWAALRGEVHYLDEMWSVYRVGVQGSWTYREFSNVESRVKHFRDINRMLDSFDRYSDYRYTDVVKRTKTSHEFSLLIEEGHLGKARSEKYRHLYKELSVRKKAILLLRRFFPAVAHGLIAVKWKTKFK